MMYGTRERFTYLECGRCGTLQLLDVPRDSSRFYPEDYYTFQPSKAPAVGSFERTARRVRTAVNLRNERAFRRLASWPRPSYWPRLLRGRATTSSRILDYGCGRGSLIYRMKRNGFTDVFGYNPFLDDDEVDYGNGIVVHGTIPPNRRASFDVVIVNHVFEHLAPPEVVLGEIAELLAPAGTLFIRTPLADSYAWRTYRTDWVQLDAPRHLFVHTRAGLELLAREAGLRILEIQDDSTAWNLYASAQYRMDIPIRDPRSYASSTPSGPNAANSLFTEAELGDFARQADEANRAGEGDQALVILGHSPS